MIEESEERLEKNGFTPSPGYIADALYNPMIYMVFDDGKIHLTMKEMERGIYYPHRAVDINNKPYGENTLLYDPTLSDFERVEELIHILKNPGKFINTQNQKVEELV